MRTICIFREGEDYSRKVNEWLEEFYHQTGCKIENMNPDENTNFCVTYDIVEYPTILTINDNGEVLASWRGQNLPLIDEVLYYMI